jgi:hypothetical protein
MKSSPVRRAVGFACGALWLAAGCSSKSGATASDGGGGATGGDAATGDSADSVVINPLCYMSPNDVISDFSLNNGVNPIDGRSGGWYTYGDKSGYGVLMPPEGSGALPDKTQGNPTCSGPGSLHVSAMYFIDWGAAMGVDWVPKVMDDMGDMVKGTYDASRYRGVAFWAKAAAPIRFVQVKFTDPWTDIPSILPADQRCVNDNTMPDKNCSPYIVKFGYGWGQNDSDGGSASCADAGSGDAGSTDGGDGGCRTAADPTVAQMWPAYANYKIDTDWKRFVVMFADTLQDPHNAGQQSPGNKLDVTKLMGMGIQVNSDHSTTPPTENDFEIWIDDVVFVE